MIGTAFPVSAATQTPSIAIQKMPSFLAANEPDGSDSTKTISYIPALPDHISPKPFCSDKIRDPPDAGTAEGTQMKMSHFPTIPDLNADL